MQVKDDSLPVDPRSFTLEPTPLAEEVAAMLLKDDSLPVDPRTFILEPMPLAETVEIPLPQETDPTGFLRPLAFVVMHHMRTFAPLVPLALATLAARPQKTALALAVYWGLVSRQMQWKDMVHRFAAWGSSNRPRLVNCMRQKRYDSSKQYLIACHPHGFLCENVANIFSRSSNMDFKKTGICPPLPGMGPLSCCFAPAVGWYPLYCELGGKFITDASMGSMRQVLKEGRSALVCPGGFSEAVYCGASKDYDHAYLDGRMGFLKLAIEFGIDIAPVYGFGVTTAYSTQKLWESGRHKRSVRAQDMGLPGVLPVGKLGTALPFNENYVSVLLDPFPTSKYTVEQLEQCSHDYSAYLQRCFDAYKACHPTEVNKELLIVGKNVDHDMAVAKLRSRL